MDLEKISGLPIIYKDCKLISKTQQLKVPKPNVRTIEQAKPFLMEPTAKHRNKLYFMYRNIHFKQNDSLLKKYKLRYDITIIPPGFNGKEFIKTVGHIHAKVSKGKTYTEVYEVIHGEAVYFFQKMKKKKVTEILVYHATAGDKVIVPPNYAHITINPSRKILIMSNWVCTLSKSKYVIIQKKHGGDYYCIKEKNKIKFIKNPSYKEHPKIKQLKAKQYKQFNLLKNKPMYLTCIENPSNFDFLIHPEQYKW